MGVSHAKQVLLVGGGGHAAVALDSLRTEAEVEVVGFTDPDAGQGGCLDAKALGDDSCWPAQFKAGVRHVVIAVGDNRLREQLAKKAVAAGFILHTSVHRSASISPSCRLGAGTVVFAGAIVNARASIGSNVIINSGAIVEHDCVIDDNAHVAPGCTLAGNVIVGKRVLIGAGAAVIPGVRIEDDAVVGAGAIVIRNVANSQTVVGNPARVMVRTSNA
jgi:UDP-perosamine 4-acetyltransferase